MGLSAEKTAAFGQPRFFNGDLNRPASSLPLGFEAVFRSVWLATPALSQVLQQFWGINTYGFKLLAVLPLNSPHHACLNPIKEGLTAEVELSDWGELPQGVRARLKLKLSLGAGQILLARALGQSNQPAALSFQSRPLESAQPNLTELDGFLLDRFVQKLLAGIKKHLIDPEQLLSLELAAGEVSPAMVRLVWVLDDCRKPLPVGMETTGTETALEGHTDLVGLTESLGRLEVILPVAALPAAPACQGLTQQGWQALIESLSGVVRLAAGYSRLPLNDLRELEPGDLLLLEKSHARELFLLPLAQGLRPHAFRIGASGPPLSQMQAQPTASSLGDSIMTAPAVPSNASASAASTMEGETLWDSLMVDVQAEFAPVRMPLKQLKQLGEGLIVEVGDLLHNPVSLSVNGKPLAHGELVLVGDQFGVLITGLATGLASPTQAQALPTIPIELAAPPAAASPQRDQRDQRESLASAPASSEASSPWLGEGLHPDWYPLCETMGLHPQQVEDNAREQGFDPNVYMQHLLESQQAAYPLPNSSLEEDSENQAHPDEQESEAQEGDDPMLATMDEVDRLLNENFSDDFED